MGFDATYVVICHNGHKIEFDVDETDWCLVEFDPVKYAKRSAGFPRATVGLEVSPSGIKDCLIVESYWRYLWRCRHCGAYAAWYEMNSYYGDVPTKLICHNGQWMPEVPGGRSIA